MRFSSAQWIAWLGATIVAALSMCGFVYGTFVTQKTYDTDRAYDDKRLERIESKVDTLLQRR